MPRTLTRKPDSASIDAILDALKVGNTRRVAANACGVSEQQFKHWLATTPSFRTAVEQAEAHAEMDMVKVLWDNAKIGGRWQASMNWLARRKPLDWGEIQRFEVYQRINEIRELQEELARENIHVPMQQLVADYQAMASASKKRGSKRTPLALPAPTAESA